MLPQQQQDDWRLLRAYVDHGSQAAFAQLVHAHVDLVHSAAVRQVHDRAMAEDVCQGVFLLLAQKAPALDDGVILPAWLLRATYFLSRNAVKRETRRRMHERKAAAMLAMASVTGCTTTVAPRNAATLCSDLLDEGINQLNERDRVAIVLRYFEQRTMAEAGAALGVSEDAAAMRVSRALAKLRLFFERRKLTLTAVEAGTILSAIAVRKAPTHLASATAHAVASTLGATASTTMVATTVGSGSASSTSSLLARATAESLRQAKLRTLLHWSAAAVAAVVVAMLILHLSLGLASHPTAAAPVVEVW